MHNFQFCGLPVSSFYKEELSIFFEESIKKNKQIVCYGHSLGIFPRLLMQPETIEYIMNYDLYVSDGHKFHKLGQYLGFPFKYRISLPELTFYLLDFANKKQLKLFLLGATEKSNKNACSKIKTKYSKIADCKGNNGYFSENEELKIIQKINNYNTDILFLGMPSPKKEKFIHKNRKKINAKIIILNGGMIDILAGKTFLAPPLIKKLGLVLLFRFIQDPKHKFKLFFTYYFLIGFYFVPTILLKIKILKKKNINLTDFKLLKKKLKKYKN